MKEIINNMKVHNGQIGDLLNRNNNIWLGVSVSLKPYSRDLAKKYLEILSEYSKDKVLIFIADDVAAINYRVLGGYGHKKARRKATLKGDEFIERYLDLIKELPERQREKFTIIRWKDVWDERANLMYKVFKEEFEKNTEFRKEVEAPVITYLINSGRSIKSSRISKMSDYILKELPFLLEGVRYKDVEYKTLLYPTYGKTSLSRLVTDIQKGLKFKNLKEKLKISGDHVLADSPILETS